MKKFAKEEPGISKVAFLSKFRPHSHPLHREFSLTPPIHPQNGSSLAKSTISPQICCISAKLNYCLHARNYVLRALPL